MNQRLWPMLAVRGEPFDSPEYLFEVKWNGIRALAGRSHESQPTGGWDLWGRELADYRTRYPEMQVLAALPPGTILDGELVLMPQGLPDLEAILARHQLSHPAKIQHASRQQPVTYVVFDLLAHHGRSLAGPAVPRTPRLAGKTCWPAGRNRACNSPRASWGRAGCSSNRRCGKVRKASWRNTWPVVRSWHHTTLVVSRLEERLQPARCGLEVNRLFMLSGGTGLRDDEIGMTRSNPNGSTGLAV